MKTAQSDAAPATDGNLVAIRRTLERADFLLSLVEGVTDDDGPHARVHLLALLDSGLEALQEGIDELDRELERRKAT